MEGLPDERIAEYLYDEVGGTSTLIREYIWLNGQVIGVWEGGQLFYVRSDQIHCPAGYCLQCPRGGRPVFATNDLGFKVWEASYLPFGGVHASSGPNIGLRFPGQWFQSESGLHQNWMRDYDPTTGRYLQGDPLGLVDGASVYGYALQNPGKFVDPRGEYVWVPFVIAAGYGAATNIAVGYVFDQTLGDGCYSWRDAAFDGSIGAIFGFAGYAATGYRGATYWASRYAAGPRYSHLNRAWPEWSHSAPTRWWRSSNGPRHRFFDGPRNNPSVFSRMNGNHVPARFHARTDPHRRWAGRNNSRDTFDPLTRTILRTPGWMTSSHVGAGTAGYRNAKD